MTAKAEGRRRRGASSTQLPYGEGDWFAVPLTTTGYGVGRVARLDGSGGVFGYFFGPKLSAAPAVGELAHLRPRDALVVGRFGDLGLVESKWPVIGRTEWVAGDWPVPVFGRVESSGDVAWRVFYSDELKVQREVRCQVAEAGDLPRDGLYGAGAIEAVLTAVLDEKVTDYLRGNLKAWRRFLDTLK